MAMNVPQDDEEEQALNSTINTTPLVDVMLVLLIIFLITIPVINKHINVKLPNAVNIATQTKPENVEVEVDAAGNVYWNNGPVKSLNDLIDDIKVAALKVPQPELHIRADREVRFESVGRVLYAIQRAGLQKVAFLSEPDRASLALSITQKH